MTITATAADNTKEWPISFGGSVIASLLNGLGWVLAAVLALLMVCLLVVVGVANVCGLGVPLGATEIAGALTLVIQYLCFSNFLRVSECTCLYISSDFQGTTEMESLATPLKWVTLFWPTPKQSSYGEDVGPLSSSSHFSSAYGIKLWGEQSLGDLRNINNAWGCLFWCCVGSSIVLIVHACVLVKFGLIEKNHTFPHRFRVGNWESRALNWFSFPASVAAAMILGVNKQMHIHTIQQIYKDIHKQTKQCTKPIIISIIKIISFLVGGSLRHPEGLGRWRVGCIRRLDGERVYVGRS